MAVFLHFLLLMTFLHGVSKSRQQSENVLLCTAQINFPFISFVILFAIMNEWTFANAVLMISKP